MNLPSNKPTGRPNKGDTLFTQMVIDMEIMLRNTQRSFAYGTLKLSNVKLKELSSVLVEFGDDVHNQIGIWDALEKYNIEFFGTPLPCILKSNESIGKGNINEQRIQYLMWGLYPELIPELVLSPSHQDLKKLAGAVADFLKNRFKVVHQKSSIKNFLGQSNEFGWDVKRKLVWLGTKSYLFRNCFRRYIEKNGGKPDIMTTDDFICQHSTIWSGLGVIDILAAVLNISDQQRSNLQSWYERHSAYYRICATKWPRTEVVNLFNDKSYTVRLSDDTSQFKAGHIVFGSLVPWNGEWYWSGEQRVFGEISDDTLRKIKNDFLRKLPQITYRYCDERAQKAKEFIRQYHDDFVKYHGDDLVIYPDGLSMAADLQKMERLKWGSHPKEVIANLMKEHNLNKTGAAMTFPDQLIQCSNGVGVYFDPDEGQQIMTGFHDIVNGFKKQGIDLSYDEENSIRLFLQSDSVSPKFIRRLVQQHGFESIESSYLIHNHDEHNLDFLLRKYKGAYYRKRYPCLALV